MTTKRTWNREGDGAIMNAHMPTRNRNVIRYTIINDYKMVTGSTVTGLDWSEFELRYAPVHRGWKRVK